MSQAIQIELCQIHHYQHAPHETLVVTFVFYVCHAMFLDEPLWRSNICAALERAVQTKYLLAFLLGRLVYEVPLITGMHFFLQLHSLPRLAVRR